MKIIQRILDAVRPFQNFCIVGHVRPDGDCIGSQLGLTLALKAEGKQVVCWNEDPIPAKLAFLDPEGLFQTPKTAKPFDCVIATDSATFERLGRIGELVKERKLFINIDHHASNTRYGDINWVSAHSPSTGELIYRLLSQARWAVTPNIADCLFTAVSTDTGSFQYPSTRPASYYVAGELVKRGADLERVCREIYHSYPLSRIRLLQRVYNRFRLTEGDRIAYFWLRKADYSQTGADKADSEGLIDHIRAIETVEVACVFEEVEPELIRISLRSKTPRVDVNKIAAIFGGGGHPAASGAKIQGSHMSVQRRVINALRHALKSAGKEPAEK